MPEEPEPPPPPEPPQETVVALDPPAGIPAGTGSSTILPARTRAGTLARNLLEPLTAPKRELQMACLGVNLAK